MNKAELVAAMVANNELSKKENETILNSFVEVVTEELQKGGKVQLAGLGTFEVRMRNARTGINPQTKEKIDIPASKAVGFKVAKALKDSVK